MAGQVGQLHYEPREPGARPTSAPVLADTESPTFAKPADQLYGLIRDTLSAQPHTIIAQEEPDPTVSSNPHGDSTLAIYSVSKYGRSDLGVNKACVTKLLALIEQAASQSSRAS